MPDKIQGTKKCNRCGKEKRLELFGNDKRGKDGKVSICRKCDSERGCQWAKNNPQKSRDRSKRWATKNIEKHREHTRKYIKCHPDYLRKWRNENPGKAKKSNKYHNDKKLKTARGRILNRISCAIRRSIRENKAGRHWESLAGYTLDQLKDHLEKQFTPEMSWGKFHQIHIDHKIPLSAFNFSKPEDIDFKRAWALENLRPMWSRENLSKGAKLEEPFQPSLQIGG
jgi:hypothetical protein